MNFVWLAFFFVALVKAGSVLPPATQWCPNCNNNVPPNSALNAGLQERDKVLGYSTVCGDGVCNVGMGESCGTCPTDCGSCDYVTPIKGCMDNNHVSLTFSDGPSEFTPSYLDILKKMGVKATFFINGLSIMEKINKTSVEGVTRGWTNSTLASFVKRAYEEGHIIGSHTYSHMGLVSGTTGKDVPSSLGYTSMDAFQMQLMANDLFIFDLIGKYPVAIRPPYAQLNRTVLNLLESIGYMPLGTTAESKDYKASTAAEAVNNTMSEVKAKKGTIGCITHHRDKYKISLDGLESLINELRSQNFKIVDLATCSNMPAWDLYRDYLYIKSKKYYTKTVTMTTTTTSQTTSTSTKTTLTDIASSTSTQTSTPGGSGIGILNPILDSGASSLSVVFNNAIEFLALGLAMIGLF